MLSKIPKIQVDALVRNMHQKNTRPIHHAVREELKWHLRGARMVIWR